MRNLTQDELSRVSAATSIQINEVGNELFIVSSGGGIVHFNNLTFLSNGCWKNGAKTKDDIIKQGEIYDGYKFMFVNSYNGTISYRLIPVS
ncbi:MAG: hypothetical protein HYX61_02940 [Gammaproteobacteria bacterium]|jgi:hypothetical protein|nr:hypothetical protein [Gammaproteobacteria bacterium]